MPPPGRAAHHMYSQSPDHPVLPAVPETEYLKGFAFEVAR